jgi:serine protease inhibitor
MTVKSASRLPRDGITFTANRPFLFFLRDDRTGVVLFGGRLTDPTSAGV